MANKIVCDICDERIEEAEGNNPITIPHPLYGKVDAVTRDEVFVTITVSWKKGPSDPNIYDLCHTCWRKIARDAAQSISVNPKLPPEDED